MTLCLRFEIKVSIRFARAARRWMCEGGRDGVRAASSWNDPAAGCAGVV